MSKKATARETERWLNEAFEKQKAKWQGQIDASNKFWSASTGTATMDYYIELPVTMTMQVDPYNTVTRTSGGPQMPRMAPDRFFDRKGRPMSLEQWAIQFENLSYRKIAFTNLSQYGVDISTVWLGLNHALRAGPPLIFETMVFRTGGASEMDMDRYFSEEEAKRGHENMVQKWLTKLMEEADRDAAGLNRRELDL